MANIVRRNEGERGVPSTGWEPFQALREWDPFRMMREMTSWDPFRTLAPMVRARTGEFTPSFDVKETKDTYVFKADLPGIIDRDLEIELLGNRLTVSGKREYEHKDEGESYYTYERQYGTFTRSFSLPDGVDFDHVEAELKDGVLTISVPKKGEYQARKVSLKGAVDKIKSALGSKEKGSA
jgi:HSP20 family protein